MSFIMSFFVYVEVLEWWQWYCWHQNEIRMWYLWPIFNNASGTNIGHWHHNVILMTDILLVTNIKTCHQTHMVPNINGSPGTLIFSPGNLSLWGWPMYFEHVKWLKNLKMSEILQKTIQLLSKILFFSLTSRRIVKISLAITWSTMFQDRSLAY